MENEYEELESAFWGSEPSFNWFNGSLEDVDDEEY